MKERLDILLVKRGLAPSREKAKAMIMEGNVFVENQREDKAGTSIPENAKIEIKGNTLKYVSRGGLKLEKAMNHFDIELQNKSVWTSGLPPAVLRIVCCKTVQAKSMRSMSDMDSLHGNCEPMNGWSVWKRQISVM